MSHLTRSLAVLACLGCLGALATTTACQGPAPTTAPSAADHFTVAPSAAAPENRPAADAAAPTRSGAAPTGSDAAPSAPAESSDFPITVDNCGFTARFDAPPERVVTVKSSATELMVALGLADRIVATAYLDGPVPLDLDSTLPTSGLPDPITHPISDKLPSLEAVLALEPDLVYAGWESILSDEGIASRERLAGLGIASLVAPSACRTAPYRPDPVTFETVFAEIEQVGAVFGRSGPAASLIATQRAELAAITPLDRPTTALWWSSATDIPYVGAGIGAPQLIMDTAGLTNIAADIPDSWTSLSWEEIVAADPDLFVLVDAAWNTADHKIDILTTSPRTRDLAAVRQRRFVIVPFPATEAGIRTVSAADDVAAQARALLAG